MELKKNRAAAKATMQRLINQYPNTQAASSAKSRLKLLPCEGTYFLLADYSAISDLDDVSFCRWLTTEIGVAAIPLSVFCADPFPHKLIRLCFAKQPATLLAAAARLCQL